MTESPADRLIGKEIECPCGKCKTETLHTVTAASGGKITRVMCNTCQGYHNYRGKSAPSQAKKVTKRSTKTSTRRSKVSWDELMSEVETKEVLDYATSDDFSVVKAIRHKNFGVGFITKVHSATKIEVMFQDGVKLLGHNIDASDLESAVA